MTDSLSEALARRALEGVARREPSADEVATLRLWGWRETGDAGWWRDEDGGNGRYLWDTALKIVRAGERRGDKPPPPEELAARDARRLRGAA